MEPTNEAASRREAETKLVDLYVADPSPLTASQWIKPADPSHELDNCRRALGMARMLFRQRDADIRIEDGSAALALALQRPPLDSDLHVLLLVSAAHVAALRGNEREARMILNRAAPVVRTGVRLPVQMQYLREKTLVAELACARQEQREAVEEALALPVPAPLKIWAWRRAIREALEEGRLDQAEQHLAEAERLGLEDRYRHRFMAWLCSRAGDVAKGLEHSDLGRPAETFGDDRRLYRERLLRWWQPRVLLLLQAGRMAEAEATVQKLREGMARLRQAGCCAQTVFDELLQARLALTRQDMPALGRCLWNVLSRLDAPPVEQQEGLALLLLHALCAGDPRTARILLHRLDPAGTRTRYQAEWARLALLEHDEERALGHLANMAQERFPYATAEALRWAWELSRADVGRLLGRLAETRCSPPVATPAPPPPHTPDWTASGVVLLGESAALASVRQAIARFAATRSSVLITGETGTGKEVIARLLHEQSPWSKAPFLPVNCGALSGFLIESELFGHLKGAFSGAVTANKGLFRAVGEGTLLLDEIHTLSLDMQAKLLRALEESEIRPVGGTELVKVHARVVATSNEDLWADVSRGTFRKDLYFRLARLHIHLPPLRERRDDILPIARHFADACLGVEGVTLAPELIERLCAYDWPGNVRQLRNAIECMALSAGQTRVLTADLFEPGPSMPVPERKDAPAAPGGPPRRPAPHRRRALLIELFKKHTRLSRGEVARMLPCALNTAASDLARLEKEGLIRRVDTSAHPRTAYYERQPGPASAPPPRT